MANLCKKICIYQIFFISLHSISKVFFFPFGATACGRTFKCPTTSRFAPQPPFEKKLRPGASKLYRKQYSKLDTFIQAILRQKTAINN